VSRCICMCVFKQLVLTDAQQAGPAMHSAPAYCALQSFKTRSCALCARSHLRLVTAPNDGSSTTAPTFSSFACGVCPSI
jgi:hypothetical protein